MGDRNDGVSLPSPEEKKSSQFDLSITLTLHLWPALTLAVTNSFGGPLSSQKRDWFAGAISDLFHSAPPSQMDVDYLEEFLLQVMYDEFELTVEDGSAGEVAGRLVGLWKMCGKGDFGGVEELRGRYGRMVEGRGGGGGEVVRWLKGGEDGKEEEEEEDSGDDDEGGEEDEEEWNGVEEMDVDQLEEVPPPRREKPAPVVDDDGFTKVMGKKRRRHG